MSKFTCEHGGFLQSQSHIMYVDMYYQDSR